MAHQNKTQKTSASPAKYLNGIVDEQRRRDCKAIAKMMREISGEKPAMWGASLVGYGEYQYRYATGREGTWMKLGLANRKKAISLYLTCDLDEMSDLLEKLGPHERGVGCLYIKRLEDVDSKVLEKMMRKAMEK